MSIAAKCTCGKFPGFCTGKGDCVRVLTFPQFIFEHNCNTDEAAKLKAFLFALRHKDSDMEMIEKIIKKYEHLIN